ncbi:MAG: hypothetical protein QM657_18725, partial [Lacrimispora sp.]|uniref:hypothetical protein n=1 Tax=Lacrimispora sp. TaxID=2719234 RepID=UPI0039E26F81
VKRTFLHCFFRLTKLNANKVNNTGGDITGNLIIRKNVPVYMAMVSDTLKGAFLKNANGGTSHDYGTQIIDITGNVQTVLVVEAGKLSLIKTVNNIETGRTTIATIP